MKVQTGFFLVVVTCRNSAHVGGLKYDLGVYLDQLGGFTDCPECGQANLVDISDGMHRISGLCPYCPRPIDDHHIERQGDHYIALCRKK